MKKLTLGLFTVMLFASVLIVGRPDTAHAACGDLPTDKGRAVITKDEDANLADLSSGQYYVWSRVKHADGQPSYILSIDGAGGEICGEQVADTNPDRANQWEWVRLSQPLSWSGGEVRVQMAGDKDQTGLDCVLLHPSNSFTPADDSKEDCNPVANDASPPSIPTSLTATSSGTQVTLRWGESTDDVGVKQYEVYRRVQGTEWPAAALHVTSELEHVDGTVTAGTTYEYRIIAVDFAGKKSTPTLPEPVTVNGGTNPQCAPMDVDGRTGINFRDVLDVILNLSDRNNGQVSATHDVNSDGSVNIIDVSRVNAAIRICNS